MVNKVIFLVPSLASGGAERVIVTLTNSLTEYYQVEIWLMVSDNIEYDVNDKVKIVKDYLSINKSGFRRIIWLHRKFSKMKNTVAISFMSKLNMCVLAASMFTKVKTIVSERNDPRKTVKKKFYKIRDFLYQEADHIVFQTEGAQNFFSQKVILKSSIVLNPIKHNLPDSYNGIRRKEIVTISRLHPQKNLKLLIQSFSEVSKVYPEYVLRIFGEGPQREELRDLAEQLHINDKVVFEGFREDVLEEVRKSDIFVLSSDFEGLSNALIESMAIGLICISTDSPPGGARMLINNMQNGILVPVGDQNRLSEAMLNVISDNDLADRIRKNSVEVRLLCDEKKICNAWKEIIDNI